MKHAVIVAHPVRTSFNRSVAEAYRQAVELRGHTVIVRDLYAMNFEPRLQAAEMPRAEGFAPGADVLAEREQLKDVDVFTFVYPLWFNAPPAILKGYIDRVFGFGFGMGRSATAAIRPCSTGAGC